MDRDELISRLREAEDTPELDDGFDSQEEAMHWAAEVAPLLSFNRNYHREFRERAHRMGLQLSADGHAANVRRMRAVIHEAIAELELQEDVDERVEENAGSEEPLDWPQHVTLAWLWHHVPWSVWASLVAAFAAVFLAGTGVGHSEWYDRLVSPHTSKTNAPSSTDSATAPKKRTTEIRKAN